MFIFKGRLLSRGLVNCRRQTSLALAGNLNPTARLNEGKLKSQNTAFVACDLADPLLNPYCSQPLSVVICFSVILKLINPITPATNEEIKITNFALLIIVSLSNARSVINMDMVNPIPAKNPTPATDCQFKSSGSLQSPSLTAKKVNRKIPTGLPAISPASIPKL